MDEKFNGIYDRQYKQVFLLAYSYMKNISDSEDVCQITFEKYLKNKPQFDSQEKEHAWFMKTAVNTCKNLLALSWKKKITFIGEEAIWDSLSSNMEYVDRREDEYELLVEIQELSLKYREVIHLFYYEEFSVKEIAGILGIKESLVTTRLNRARKKLGDKIERRDKI